MNSQIKDNLVFRIERMKDKINRYLAEEYIEQDKKVFKRYLDEIYPTYRRSWGDKEYRASDILESLDPVLFKREMNEYYEKETEVLEKKLAELEAELNNMENN